MIRRRNGMCPACFAKAILTPHISDASRNPVLFNNEPYNNGIALTPPMGWSSWNTFSYYIDEKVVLETAKIMKEKGLVDAGYVYLNIDDCWENKTRTMEGELTTDHTTFPSGMPQLVKKVNELGVKLGIYSSNGTLTCQDYPATLGHEYIDAYTFAKWGIEYWKLDYCHHINTTQYAPLIGGIAVSEPGAERKPISCREGTLSGSAHIFGNHVLHTRGAKPVFKEHVSGLDANLGSITFNIPADEDGEYVLTVYTHEKYKYEKFFVVQVNGGKIYPLHIPKGIRWTEYTIQQLIPLNKGMNTIKLFNPIQNKATSDMLQYQYVGKCIKEATKRVAEETGNPEKKMMFSICEWGDGFPHFWGSSAGNLWRTTGDISAKWSSIRKIYEHNVTLHKYAGPGGWNDPDMLEVGVGSLTYTENESHFVLWCMMASPLILGNDIRKMSDEVLKLITYKPLIDINQDALGKQCIRVAGGQLANVDLLAKPLSNDKTAICVFNKSLTDQPFNFDEKLLLEESYIKYSGIGNVTDVITGEKVDKSVYLKGTLKAKSVRIFII